MKSNKSILLYLFLFTVLGSFTSCIREDSDSVDQDKIFTEYELFYNANEDKTYARATFKFSNVFGTKLELSEMSEIKFNGEPLTFNAFLAYYEKEYAGFVDTGTFRWTDLDGNIFTNSISVKPLSYGDGITTISRDASFDLSWSGDPLGEDENVTVVVNGENELDAKTFITNDLGTQSIILDRDKLQGVGAGPGTIFLDWRYIPLLNERTSAGGLITGRYRPLNLNVVFE
jgi:hypothetical protein